MRGMVVSLIVAVLAVGMADEAAAHGGGLNAQGCHNDYVHGGYHCHRSPGAGTYSRRRSTRYRAPPVRTDYGDYSYSSSRY